jgi:hypothetical protein
MKKPIERVRTMMNGVLKKELLCDLARACYFKIPRGKSSSLSQACHRIKFPISIDHLKTDVQNF